jgi:hypothetical protein
MLPSTICLDQANSWSNFRLREGAMRVLVKVSLPVEAANQSARQGELGKTIQSILEDQKPEAAYFVAEGGKRTGYLFIDLLDVSQIPGIAEPWFLAFNASVEITPAMTLKDLAAAGPAIEKAVRKFGSTTHVATA